MTSSPTDPKFSTLAPVVSRFARHDRAAYGLWAALWTLASSRRFYGYMLKQTAGEWSAPLDDVFIHFDYARSIALGHPFEWVPGNGYSSGNTSLTYPFALALGYLGGFRAESLMIWAALVAAVSVFGLLLAARRFLFAALRDDDTPSPSLATRLGAFVLPPMLLGVGALVWSYWSGMEVAFFLGVWALTLVAFLAFEREARAPEVNVRALRLRALALGSAGGLLVVTRPEAATCIAVFGVFAAVTVFRSHGMARAVETLLTSGVPSVLLLGVQSVANRVWTGEWSANGALVKLAVNNPFMSREDKVADWFFNLKYQVFRCIEYHFTDASAYAMLVPGLALLAFAIAPTRRFAWLLGLQIVGWLVLVSFNGQVRWQNERYTMPAVAWLMLLASVSVVALLRKKSRPQVVALVVVGVAIGEGVAVTLRPEGLDPTLRWSLMVPLTAAATMALLVFPVRVVVVFAALGLFAFHQEPKMRDQKWFFGRASRNIRDQHTRAGRFLASIHPRRVLVGDAGALLYASNRPGLDIIGLGGYHDLPFARAGVQGLPATLELVERMPAAERPDVFAIYPTWWGVLPTWFTSEVLARFPVEGNVICGGYEKVIYRADWSVLGTGTMPRIGIAQESVKDSFDAADLVDERAHRYRMPGPGGGFTDMKILADPADPTADLWDAGRRIAGGLHESFHVRGIAPGRPGHLVVRTAPEGTATIHVVVGGTRVATRTVERVEGWTEEVFALPEGALTLDAEIRIENEGPADFVDYHAWVLQ
ncbi:MAG: hypothetical protein U0169_03800 [Polyangiaceae bacterium]